jgi:hypothetical protein
VEMADEAEAYDLHKNRLNARLCEWCSCLDYVAIGIEFKSLTTEAYGILDDHLWSLSTGSKKYRGCALRQGYSASQNDHSRSNSSAMWTMVYDRR